MRNEIEEELMRQADREEREKVLNKPEMEREFPAEQAETEVEELLKEYDLADRPIGTLSDPDSALGINGLVKRFTIMQMKIVHSKNTVLILDPLIWLHF